MARVAIDVARLQGMVSVPKDEAPAVSAQTWLKGGVLVANGGELQEGGTNPTDIVGVAIHKNPPTNTTSETGYYVPAREHIEFVGSIDDNGDLGNGAIALTDRYTAYGITEDSSGVWYVDKGKTAAADVRVVITGFQDAVGTTNGRVYFQFLDMVNVDTAPTRVTVYGSRE